MSAPARSSLNSYKLNYAPLKLKKLIPRLNISANSFIYFLKTNI